VLTLHPAGLISPDGIYKAVVNIILTQAYDRCCSCLQLGLVQLLISLDHLQVATIDRINVLVNPKMTTHQTPVMDEEVLKQQVSHMESTTEYHVDHQQPLYPEEPKLHLKTFLVLFSVAMLNFAQLYK
jgi:hypothetical protein